MGDIKDAADNAWRDFTINGVPSSGEHKAEKADIRDVLTLVEGEIQEAKDMAAGLAFEGDWDSGTTYAIGQSVSYDGGSYVSRIDANLNNEPDASPTEWQLLSEPGAAGSATSNSTFLLTGIASPTSLSADANNYNPTDLATKSTFRLTSSVDVKISGLIAGSDGDIKVLENANAIGGATITLLRDQGSASGSSTGNRFSLPVSLVLRPRQSIWLRYDGTLLRWTAVSSDSKPRPATVQITTTRRGNTSLNDLEVGGSQGGVTLAFDDLTLLFEQTDPLQNGLYQSVGSSAGIRAIQYSFNDLCGAEFIIAKGDYAGLKMRCTTTPGGTFGVDALTFVVVPDTASAIDPPALTDDTVNYAPTGVFAAGLVRLTSTDNVGVSGVEPGVPGMTKVLMNNNAAGGPNIILYARRTTSTSGRRFDFPGDIVLRPGQAVTIRYDDAWSSMSSDFAPPVGAVPVFAAADTDQLFGSLAIGSVQDGLVLQFGKVTLLTAQSDPKENGVYLTVGSSAGIRDPRLSYDDICGREFLVQAGQLYGGRKFRCTSAPGGILDVSALTFELVEEQHSLLYMASWFATYSFMNALATKPSITAAGIDWWEMTRRYIHNRMLDGSWERADILAIPFHFSEEASKKNLKTPGTLDISVAGTVTWAQATAFTGDGTTGYLSTGYTPSGTGAYKLGDSEILGWWGGASTGDTNTLFGTTASTTRAYLQPRRASGSVRWRLNDESNSDISPTGMAIDPTPFGSEISGVYGAQRSPHKRASFREEQIYYHQTNVEVGLPTVAILGLRSSSTYSIGPAGVVYVGGYLTDRQRKGITRDIDQWRLDTGASGRIPLPQPRLMGNWIWYTEPSVVHINGNELCGIVNTPLGHIAHGHPARGIVELHAVPFPAFSIDDHCNQAFLWLASGYLLCIWSGHNSASYWVAKSKAPVTDVTKVEWSDPVNIASQTGTVRTSYALPYQDGDGRIHLFLRNGLTSAWTVTYTYSDDDGATWATALRVCTDGRPYLKTCHDTVNDRIHMFTNDGHPYSVATNSLYHCYLDCAAGTFHETDGTLISTPPWTPASSFTMVYDGDPIRSWVWQAAMDPVTGTPMVLFTTLPDYPEATNNTYNRARLVAGVWEHEEICNSGDALEVTGQPGYAGGMAFDYTNTDVVYTSEKVDGVHQLFRRARVGTNDWTAKQLTFGTTNCFRPYLPHNSRRLFYVFGNEYTDILSFPDCEMRYIELDEVV